ncbi:Imm32 family immunity protein [Streptomyces virginiae]|uniref:Imm32 family immunity protein n=1 Tax=Streptomyces virginiae TaxID=1961 RepID=UPI00341AB2EC
MNEPLIKVQSSVGEAHVKADAEGLRVLAERLSELAGSGVRDGHHLHCDAGVDEDGSSGLVLDQQAAGQPLSATPPCPVWWSKRRSAAVPRTAPATGEPPDGVRGVGEVVRRVGERVGRFSTMRWAAMRRGPRGARPRLVV